MAFEKKTFAPDAIAKARELYEDTQTPLEAVAASLGIARTTLARRIIEWGWTPRKGAKVDNAPRKATKPAGGAKPRNRGAKRQSLKRGRIKLEKKNDEKPLSETAERGKSRTDTGHLESPPCEPKGPAALAVRVQRVVERELDAIDQILGAIGAADAVEAERSARTLASLARALKEVMRLAAPDEPADADDDDPVPRDLDEFRRELARRIEALAGDTPAQTSGDGG